MKENDQSGIGVPPVREHDRRDAYPTLTGETPIPRYLLLITALCIGCAPASQSPLPPMRVFCAASTQEATRIIATEFAKTNHRKVEVIADDSARLAAQIEQGAPADLFLSAHPRWTEHLAKQNLVIQQAPLLSNQLVIAVPRDQLSAYKNIDECSLQDWLNDPRLRRIAIAGENVPAGIYARQALQALKVSEALEHDQRLVISESVRAVLALVEQGEVDAGIVYKTDVALTSRVATACEIPADLHAPILYIVAQTSNAPGAQELYRAFLSESAQATFDSFGFTSPKLVTP